MHVNIGDLNWEIRSSNTSIKRVSFWHVTIKAFDTCIQKYVTEKYVCNISDNHDSGKQ